MIGYRIKVEIYLVYYQILCHHRIKRYHFAFSVRAKEKAASMTTHIAYPDELLNDDKLTKLYDKVRITKKLDSVSTVAVVTQLVALCVYVECYSSLKTPTDSDESVRSI